MFSLRFEWRARGGPQPRPLKHEQRRKRPCFAVGQYLRMTPTRTPSILTLSRKIGFIDLLAGSDGRRGDRDRRT